MTATPGPSLTTADLLQRVREKHPELFVVPEVEPWPQGLQRPLKVPSQARCFDAGGNELGAGAWTPKARGDAIASKLTRLKVYPGQAQGRLNEFVGVIRDQTICAAAGDGSGKAATAAADARCVGATPVGHSTWTVVKWATGTALGGLVVGGITVLLLTR